MVGARFKILDDPDRRLAQLKRTTRNKILRKAAQAGAPRGETGALAASQGVRIATNRRTGAVYAVVGPRRRYTRKKRGKILSQGAPTKIAHLIEGGVRPHSTRKGDTLGRTQTKGGKLRITAHRQTAGGQHPGHKANPFLRRAWQSSESRAVAKMREVIEAELQRIDSQ